MDSKSTSKKFPGFLNTFWLHESGGGRSFRGEISLSAEDAFAVTRAEKVPGPVEVRWAMGGKQPSDIIRTTSVAPVLASDKVIDILQTSGFSGWQKYPISLFSSTGELIPGYNGLAINGRCGPLDPSLSKKVDKIYPAGIFPAWKGLYLQQNTVPSKQGLYFDANTWDGSDIFMPAGISGWIFVVDEVKKAFVKAKIKNVLFESLAEIELDSLTL